MILVNGECQTHLAIADRAIQYGDGVWETLVYRNGRLEHFDRHMDRLEKGLTVLNMPLQCGDDKPLNRRTLRRDIDTLLQLKQEEKQTETLKPSIEALSCVIKIIISRGSGGRGYSPVGLDKAVRIVSIHPLATFSSSWYTEGINLTLCQTRLGHQPLLAGFKHLNRLEQVLARSEFDPTYQEGLVCDYHGHVIEGTMSNLFMVDDEGVMHTPDLELCGIEGVIRQCILDYYNTAHVRNITLDEVMQASGLFLCNSVIGIWPVQQFQGQVYQIPDIIRQLQADTRCLLGR